MSDAYKSIDTRLIHTGEPEPRYEGAVSMPIFQSAMFETEGGGNYHAIKYIRLNNTPNHDALHAKLAALEGGEAALVTGSGMAAISGALLAVLRNGDHVLAQGVLYGGTHSLFTKCFDGWGIEYDFVDARDPSSWESKLKSNTRAFYVEAISNPLLDVGDLEGVVAFSKAHGLVSLIDNTFPSPYNFRAPEWGFDLSLHSGTKYLNGHSDIVCGAAVGRADLVEKTWQMLKHTGGALDPHACFLLHRGLKTLAVRMRQHNENAMAIAAWLEAHAAVERVHYPGLESSPDHARARKLFDGFSGMVSFELAGGGEATKRMMDRVEIPVIAPSLGGVESLLTRPAMTSHLSLTPEERAERGITDGLVRMSVGIESAGDLIADLEQALEG